MPADADACERADDGQLTVSLAVPGATLGAESAMCGGVGPTLGSEVAAEAEGVCPAA